MVKCEICGRLLWRLASHVRVHNISLREYKKRFPEAETSEPSPFVRNEAKAGTKPIKEVAAMNEKTYVDEICNTCKKPLLKLTWGVNGYGHILVCDNSRCARYRQPQGTGRKK